jgi:hypothetical protein
MAKPRSPVHHRTKRQVRRDALLHSRSGWLYYRSWAEQAGLHLRLNGTTRESICGDRVHSGDVRSWRADLHRPPRSPRAPMLWQHCTPTCPAQTKSGLKPCLKAAPYEKSLVAPNLSWPDRPRKGFSSWLRTQKNWSRPTAGGSLNFSTANLSTRRRSTAALPATSPRKLATLSSE